MNQKRCDFCGEFKDQLLADDGLSICKDCWDITSEAVEDIGEREERIMDLQKVYEVEDYGMGVRHTKVGLRVDDRVIWFACTYCTYASNTSKDEEFKKMESLIDEIVVKCHTPSKTHKTNDVQE